MPLSVVVCEVQSVRVENPRIYRLDASGCNGCDVAILEMPTMPSFPGLGIEMADAPEDANVLLVTGGANVKSAGNLRAIHARLRTPARVVAVGACAATLGIFKGGYAVSGPIDRLVPVDLYVTGCPPRPQTLLAALADALQLSTDGVDSPVPPPGYRGRPDVDEAACMGCGACAHVCPADAIQPTRDAGRLTVDFRRGDCIGCGSCQDVCPTQAITLRPDERAWSTEKPASAATPALSLVECLACGTPFVPLRQIQWVMRRLEEEASPAVALRAGLERSLRTCPACRRSRLGLVREGAGLLARMAAPAEA